MLGTTVTPNFMLGRPAADEGADLDAAVAAFGQDRREEREDMQHVGPQGKPHLDARAMQLLGNAGGVVEQYLGGADLDQDRRQPLEVGMERRGERRLGVL